MPAKIEGCLDIYLEFSSQYLIITYLVTVRSDLYGRADNKLLVASEIQWKI